MSMSKVKKVNPGRQEVWMPDGMMIATEFACIMGRPA
jgi:hypothetical protein